MLYRALLYALFYYTLQSSAQLCLLYRVCSALLVLQSLLYSAYSTESALLCLLYRVLLYSIYSTESALLYLFYRVCSTLLALQSPLYSACSPESTLIYLLYRVYSDLPALQSLLYSTLCSGNHTYCYTSFQF